MDIHLRSNRTYNSNRVCSGGIKSGNYISAMRISENRSSTTANVGGTAEVAIGMDGIGSFRLDGTGGGGLSDIRNMIRRRRKEWI